MRAKPGELLKRLPRSATTLTQSVQSRQLTAHLHDLIIIAYETSTNRRGSSLSLERLEYVSGAEHGGKYYMRLSVLVKEAALNETVPLTVTFTADLEDIVC